MRTVGVVCEYNPFHLAMPGSWPFSGSRTQRRQWCVS